MRLLLATPLIVALWSTSAQAEKAPTYAYDPYKKTLTVSGAAHWHNALLDLNKWEWNLAISVVDGVTHNPILFVDVSSPDWYFFDHAADSQGTPLKVLPAARSVEGPGAGVREQIGVEIPIDYVRAHRDSGMNIKIWGPGGDITIQVPAEAVTTFADGAIKIIRDEHAEAQSPSK